MKLALTTLGVLAALALAAIAACDPVHNEKMAALGDEAPNVRKGPLHRPGQPCTTCHDGKLGSPPEFTVAGTIYQNDTDAVPAASAVVTLTDANNKTFQAKTNAAGNFYTSPQEFTPAYPMKTEVAFGGVTVVMTSLIGRAGSCTDCHVDPYGPTSPGHIFIPGGDGGTP